MVYILTAQLYDESIGYAAFDNYRTYLAGPARALPPGARALATSEWYWNSNDHRCPHDAWLEAADVRESADGALRKVSIHVRLLGAYHDGHIELVYHGVRRYRIELEPKQRDLDRGHRDWRHDEFRVSEPGHFEHEIEWWGAESSGTWLIDAAEIEYQWLPAHPEPVK